MLKKLRCKHLWEKHHKPLVVNMPVSGINIPVGYPFYKCIKCHKGWIDNKKMKDKYLLECLEAEKNNECLKGLLEKDEDLYDNIFQ